MQLPNHSALPTWILPRLITSQKHVENSQTLEYSTSVFRTAYPSTIYLLITAMELGTAIVGLVVAGAQISAVLNRFISSCTNAPSAAHSIYQEVGEFRIVLQKLQHIVFSPEPLDNEKASLIDTGPISFTLVHCVCTFDELEKELKRMKLDEFNLEGKKLGVWHRMRWSLVEQTMSAMILRIQNHKSTLGILLSVLLSYASIWSSPLFFGVLFDSANPYGLSQRIHQRCKGSYAGSSYPGGSGCCCVAKIKRARLGFEIFNISRYGRNLFGQLCEFYQDNDRVFYATFSIYFTIPTLYVILQSAVSE